MIRRLLASLLLALSLGFAVAVPGLARTLPQPNVVSSGPTHVELAAPDGRKIDVSVWLATDERGVIVFSHGAGGRPEAYSRIITEWMAAGFSVVAPLHVDSQSHPDRTAFDGPTSFFARIADLSVVRGYVKTAHSGRPLIAAGHSYGSLLSMMAGGATTAVGPQGDPAIRAVIALSSPGNIPGLVTPATWASLTTPTLMITGDADLVDGIVANWRDHRSPFDLSPAGGKLLLVFAGGDHSLVGDADAADFALMSRTTIDFMRAHALDDADARARLHALASSDGVTVEKR